MKKILPAIFFALILCSYGYSQEEPNKQNMLPSFTLDPVISDTNGASVALDMGKTQYSALEPIKLTIALKNGGDKMFDIVPIDVEWFYNIEVTAPDGKILPFKNPRRSIYKALSGNPLNPTTMPVSENLRPGETKKAQVWLSSLFDMSTPGTYKITVSKTFMLGQLGGNAAIKSASTTVEVSSAHLLSEWLPN